MSFYQSGTEWRLLLLSEHWELSKQNRLCSLPAAAGILAKSNWRLYVLNLNVIWQLIGTLRIHTGGKLPPASRFLLPTPAPTCNCLTPQVSALFVASTSRKNTSSEELSAKSLGLSLLTWPSHLSSCNVSVTRNESQALKENSDTWTPGEVTGCRERRQSVCSQRWLQHLDWKMFAACREMCHVANYKTAQLHEYLPF